MVAIDPLSALVALPILGPVVAFLLWEIRDMRKEHTTRIVEINKAHDGENAATLERLFSMTDDNIKANVQLANALTLLAERLEHDNRRMH